LLGLHLQTASKLVQPVAGMLRRPLREIQKPARLQPQTTGLGMVVVAATQYQHRTELYECWAGVTRQAVPNNKENVPVTSSRVEHTLLSRSAY